MMTRLSQSKTEKLIQSFIRAILLPMAMRKPGLGPDDVIQQLNGLQPG